MERVPPTSYMIHSLPGSGPDSRTIECSCTPTVLKRARMMSSSVGEYLKLATRSASSKKLCTK